MTKTYEEEEDRGGAALDGEDEMNGQVYKGQSLGAQWGFVACYCFFNQFLLLYTDWKLLDAMRASTQKKSGAHPLDLCVIVNGAG